MTISFAITSAQAADFQRCADLAGIDLADWIKQCAQVHAAAAIDAMQATERQARTERRVDNETNNARNRRRREERRRSAL